jgi:GDSL-like Lipase/Acylhydrolase family
MKRIRSSLRGTLSAATALAIVMAGLAGFAAGAPRASSAITSYSYVAMGDSLSSGEGTGSYISPTDTPGTNMCHRSVLSFAAQYVQISADTWDLDNVACSGAGASQIYLASNPNTGLNPDPDPAQDTDLNSSTNLVTVSIGINDLGLLNLATTCYEETGSDENTCFLNIPTSSTYLKALGSLASDLDSAFFDIRNSAKNATVAVLTYPQIFPAPANYSGPCQQWGFPVIPGVGSLVTSSQMLAVAQSLVNALNSTIANEVKGRSNFILVDESNALAGHDVCQPDASRWVNQIVRPSLSGAAPESLHPMTRGYQQMATVLAARLDPGYFSNLTQDTNIFNAYKEDGGLGAFGWPYDNGGGTYVHYWNKPGENVQDFTGNGSGTVTFVDGPDGAFFVASPFWSDYVSGNYVSTCLSPTDNAYSYNGGARQDFVNCYMTWTSSGGVVVHGPNPATCTNYGGSNVTGPNACIGFTTAPPPGQPASGNVWFSGGGVGLYGQEIWTYANGTVATSTAIYTLTGLNTAKASQLQAYIPSNDSDASHAHYHFCTPSGGCADGYVNQNDYTNQWATFGTVCSSDGTATITLADDGGDNYPAIVGADAIRAVATTGINCAA